MGRSFPIQLETDCTTVTNVNEGLGPGENAPDVRKQRRYGVHRQLRALCVMRPRQIAALLTKGNADWSSDGAARLGAALADFTLFSVAPVMIVITGVVGLFVGHAAAQGQVAPWLQRFLSADGAQAAELMLKQTATPAGGILTTAGGLLTLFLGTSALIGELRQSMNIVWRVQQPPSQDTGIVAAMRALLGERLYAFLIVIGAGLLVLASLVVNTTVTVMATYFQGWLPIPATVLQIVNVTVSFGLMTTVFTLVYKMVPDAHVSVGRRLRRGVDHGAAVRARHRGIVDIRGDCRRLLPVRDGRQCVGAADLGVLLRSGVLLWCGGHANLRQ